MTRKNAIIFIAAFCALFVFFPLLTIFRTVELKSGWNGLNWNSTESQVEDWVRKNNTNFVWTKCELSHFGVVCKKLSWKKAEDNRFECIEFQFQDGKLCAVIESGNPVDYNPVDRYKLGKPESGRDLDIKSKREYGTVFELTDRAHYYSSVRKSRTVRVRHAVSRLVVNIPSDLSFPDEIRKYRLTTGYYRPDFYDSLENKNENFPSKRFW